MESELGIMDVRKDAKEDEENPILPGMKITFCRSREIPDALRGLDGEDDGV
jgi:hypothetical protein